MSSYLRTIVDRRTPGAEASIIAEEHTISEHTANRVFLEEAPLSESPSTVSVTGTPAGGGTFSATTDTPAAGEYRVIYDGIDGGALEFNAADTGIAITVTYKGRGSVLRAHDINSIHDSMWAMAYHVDKYDAGSGVAVPDGSTDNYAAVAALLEYVGVTLGGGTVYFPPVNIDAGEYWRTSQVWRMYDNVRVTGAGRASEIRNDHTTPESLTLGAVFQMGWYYEGYWDDITDTYALSDVTQGDREITFTSPADSGSFAAGDLVFIRSAAETGSLEPAQAWVTEIDESGSGVAGLRDPVPWDITGASVWNVTDHQPDSTDQYALPINLVRNAVIENIAVRCNYFWLLRVGMYRCRLENIYVLSSQDLFNANVDNYSVVKGITGHFNGGVIETVQCFNTRISDIQASWVPNTDNPNSTNRGELIALDGATRGVTLHDFMIDAGAYDQAGSVNYGMRLMGQDIKVRDGIIRASNLNIAVDVRNASSANNVNIRTSVDRVVFDLEGSPVTRYLKVGGGSGGFDITGLRIRDCDFYGPTPSSDAASLDDCVDGRFTNLDFPSGAITFTADAHDNHIDGVRGVTAYSGAGADLNWITPPEGTLDRKITIADGDATPSVKYGDLFTTAHTSPLTMTALDDGYVGQEVDLIFGDNNTTVDFSGTTLRGNGGVDWEPDTNDSMRCRFNGTNWFCHINDATL